MQPPLLEQKGDLLPRWLLLLLAGCGLMMLVAGMSVRFSAVAIWDDAWFYTRYAGNLLESGSYQWNPGEKGHGLTAPLFGILVLAIQSTGLNPALVLWGLSFTAGVLAISSIVFWVWKNQGSVKSNGRFLLGYALLVVGWNVPTLSSHFASGMETTTSVLYFWTYLVLFHQFSQKLSPGRTLILGFLGGLAWGIRPELAMLTWGIPVGMVFFSKRPSQRTGAAYIVLFTAAITLLQMYIGLKQFGTVLPLSFWVKSTNPYGQEMAESLRWGGLKQLVLFLAVNIPSVLALVAAFSRGRRDFWRFLGLHERILLIALVLFWIYHGLLVLPIMSYSARFFYPLWPGLVWLGLRSVQFLMKTTEEGRGVIRLNKMTTYLLALTLLLTSIAGSLATIRTRHSGSVALLGKFDVKYAYEGVGKGNWVGLDEFSRWPKDLVIASTELGILGMMRQGAEVIDLSGLHDGRMLRPRLGIDNMMRNNKPDLIYMPSPGYSKLDSALRQHPDFISQFELHHPNSSYYPIAVKRKGAYYLPIVEIINRP